MDMDDFDLRLPDPDDVHLASSSRVKKKKKQSVTPNRYDAHKSSSSRSGGPGASSGIDSRDTVQEHDIATRLSTQSTSSPQRLTGSTSLGGVSARSSVGSSYCNSNSTSSVMEFPTVDLAWVSESSRLSLGLAPSDPRCSGSGSGIGLKRKSLRRTVIDLSDTPSTTGRPSRDSVSSMNRTSISSASSASTSRRAFSPLRTTLDEVESSHPNIRAYSTSSTTVTTAAMAIGGESSNLRSLRERLAAMRTRVIDTASIGPDLVSVPDSHCIAMDISQLCDNNSTDYTYDQEEVVEEETGGLHRFNEASGQYQDHTNTTIHNTTTTAAASPNPYDTFTDDYNAFGYNDNDDYDYNYINYDYNYDGSTIDNSIPGVMVFDGSPTTTYSTNATNPYSDSGNSISADAEIINKHPSAFSARERSSSSSSASTSTSNSSNSNSSSDRRGNDDINDYDDYDDGNVGVFTFEPDAPSLRSDSESDEEEEEVSGTGGGIYSGSSSTYAIATATSAISTSTSSNVPGLSLLQRLQSRTGIAITSTITSSATNSSTSNSTTHQITAASGHDNSSSMVMDEDNNASTPPITSTSASAKPGGKAVKGTKKKTTATTSAAAATNTTTATSAVAAGRTGHSTSSSTCSTIIGRVFPSDESEEGRYIDMPAGWEATDDWEVVLLVDIREKENVIIQTHLLGLGIPCETAQLILGDFLWAARRVGSAAHGTSNSNSSGGDINGDNHDDELGGDATATRSTSADVATSSTATIKQKATKTKATTKKKSTATTNDPMDLVVLDCIIERKTTKDLAASIRDGRYKEQKRRLLRCGCRVPIYVVEGLTLSVGRPGFGGSRGVNSAALESAIISTQVSGIPVYRTRGLDHTISFLAAIHHCVVDRFHAGGNFPSVCPFPTFQRLNGKYIPRNMIELFATQLRQIPKCSEECAVSLALRFESIGGLVSFIDSCPSTKAAEKYIAGLSRGPSTTRKVGKSLASFIVALFTEDF